MPYGFHFGPDHNANLKTLADRLNELDAFDKEIEFKQNDILIIVFNNHPKNEDKRMLFCMEYKNRKWVEHKYDFIDIDSSHDRVISGEIKELQNL